MLASAPTNLIIAFQSTRDPNGDVEGFQPKQAFKLRANKCPTMTIFLESSDHGEVDGEEHVWYQSRNQLQGYSIESSAQD